MLTSHELNGMTTSPTFLQSRSHFATNSLLFVGVEQDFASSIASSLHDYHRVELIVGSNALYVELESRSNSINAVLLGPKVQDQVEVAQRIYALDKRLPVIILGDESQCAQLRANLMFVPYVGYEVLVWPTNDTDGLVDVLADAAHRRQQRQRFHEASVANAHVRLEVLPLLQPEAAQYVEELLDHQPIGVLATDIAGKIVTTNVQARELLDASEAQTLGASIFRFFPKPERRRLKILLSLALNSGGRLTPEVFEFCAADGHTTYLEVTIGAFSNQAGKSNAMFLLQDVTLRVQSEKQHTEAVVELRLIATVLRAFHAISTGGTDQPAQRIRKFLRLGCEQFGMPVGILSRIEDETFYILEAFSNSIKYQAGNKLPLELTYCGTTAQSTDPIAFAHARETKWRDHPTYKVDPIESYMGVRIIVDGSVFGTLCFLSRSPRIHPFTPAERETLKLMSQWIAAELQRERSEGHMRKLSSALEQTADSVVITDFRGNVEYVNPSFESLTGYEKRDVLGKPANFLQVDNSIQSEMWNAIRRGSDYRFLLTSKTRAGQIYHVQMTISPLKNSGETTHLIATGQDVTALIEAKEKERERQIEIIHVARLSTLGGMVSGIAHELNQPLCAIMMYAQTCLRKLGPADDGMEEIRHGINQIVRQAERADEIFTRIRNFSRKRDMRRQRINIREIVENALSFVEMEIRRSRIRLETHLPKRARYVNADNIQIQQVLINLIRNSLDALETVDEAHRRISIKVGAGGAQKTKIMIADNGCGCAEQDLNRLFEPFYTTKAAGLGVGLSISQGIIEAHDGKLWLQSTSTSGSTFCMTLPNARGT